MHETSLDAVRSRALLYGSYVVWAITALLAVVAAAAWASLMRSWLGAVQATRAMFGFAAPAGPDWLLVAAACAGVALPVVAGFTAWAFYRRAWRRRLDDVWGASGGGYLERIGARPNEYVTALVATSRWSAAGIAPGGEQAAEAVLAALEPDIAQRAWSLGLVVGMSHRGWIDSVAIAASAFELQMHVLTSLGKRPNASTWVRLWKRCAASLFTNWYLNGEQSLTFRLMIRKIGLGMQAGAQVVEQAADALAHWDAAPDDVDWDETEHLLPEHVLGLPVRSVSRAAAITTGTLVSVGAFGMEQIGRFIEQCGEDLFQGALAATILYGHGVALAGDCLALDAAHRASPAFNPRVDQVMTRMCTQAGMVLRDQVRSLRATLRERRRLLVKMAKERSGSVTSQVKSATTSAWDKAKQAARSMINGE